MKSCSIVMWTVNGKQWTGSGVSSPFIVYGIRLSDLRTIRTDAFFRFVVAQEVFALDAKHQQQR